MAAALVMSGCASTEPELVAARDSWRGARYDDVVKTWGPPDKSATKGGRETHTWVARDGVPGPHGGAVVSGGGAGGAGGALFGPPSEQTAVCERVLVFSAGRVVEQAFNGPPEFCKRFNKK